MAESSDFRAKLIAMGFGGPLVDEALEPFQRRREAVAADVEVGDAADAGDVDAGDVPL